MRSITSPARVSAFSFFIFFVLVFVLIGSDGPSALKRLSIFCIPISLASALYFLIRWIGVVRSSHRPISSFAVGSIVPFDPAAPRGWVTSVQVHASNVGKAVAELNDDELIAISVHPDSSAQILAKASQELTSRGILSEDVDSWMPSAERLYVPSALRGSSSPSAYIAAVRVRETLFGLSRSLLIAAVAYYLCDRALANLNGPLSIYAPLPITLVSAAIALIFHDWHVRTAGLIFLTLTLAVAILMSSGMWVGPNGGTFMGTAYALLLIASIISHGTRARILLLRPFGKAAMSGALSRVAMRRIGPFGSVFTLSDRNYKPSSALDILRLFGVFRHLVAPLLRPSLRIASVWNDASYRGFAKTLANNVLLDFQSAYCGGQAFNVASANNWWKNCIDLLLHSTDIIVMDVSRVQAGSTWEIVRLFRRDVLDRTIFIAHVDHLEHAQEALEKHLPAGTSPLILLYHEDGHFIDSDVFEQTVKRALSIALAHT